MNSKPYLIPAEPVSFEEEIKKSVFITYLAHTPSIDSAKAFVEQIKRKHADARHNCWGFVAGRPEDSMKYGFSDDGEPSGTAGKPILAQLSGSGVGEITAVVTRYSGGIKLGTGGLVKAYGGGVQQALKLLQTIEKKITTNVLLTLDYSLMPIAQTVMGQFEATTVNADYQSQVLLTVELELSKVEEFRVAIINKSGAKIGVASQEATKE
ncbi:YigZ family protein [Vibrio sp. SCSIO 43136]|uniref:YigZ family protein n=1 Tax=Vibrio sp. SCSIO 43136 TaxID=2819101 RepID=UPI002076414B|nr:YigZ family protein [Vibrio sp. SCSIO 43136]USD65268.1 YigZ family protein [Vibrio sp. SCSIO 43136]